MSVVTTRQTTLPESNYHAATDYAPASYVPAHTTSAVPRHSISTTSTTAMYPATKIYFTGRYYKHFSCGAITLSLIALAFYIITLATPAYYAVTQSSNTGIGPFYACSRDGSGDRACDNIDTDCHVNRNGVTNTLGLPNCSMWNALRALMVIAAALAILAIIWMIFSIISVTAFRISMFFNFLGALCGLTVMILGIIYYYDYVRNENGRYTDTNALELGYGFILATIAWPLQLFASCCFGRSVYY